VQIRGAPFRRYPQQVINIHGVLSKLFRMMTRIVTFPKMT
jgi:hypothetical protein